MQERWGLVGCGCGRVRAWGQPGGRGLDRCMLRPGAHNRGLSWDRGPQASGLLKARSGGSWARGGRTKTAEEASRAQGVFEMGADLAGKHACPQSDDRMGNPFPRHSWKSTRPPTSVHLQAPPELTWQAGSGFGCCWAGCHRWAGGGGGERTAQYTKLLPPFLPAPLCPPLP